MAMFNSYVKLPEGIVGGVEVLFRTWNLEDLLTAHLLEFIAWGLITSGVTVIV